MKLTRALAASAFAVALLLCAVPAAGLGDPGQSPEPAQAPRVTKAARDRRSRGRAWKWRSAWPGRTAPRCAGRRGVGHRLRRLGLRLHLHRAWPDVLPQGLYAHHLRRFHNQRHARPGRRQADSNQGPQVQLHGQPHRRGRSAGDAARG